MWRHVYMVASVALAGWALAPCASGSWGALADCASLSIGTLAAVANVFLAALVEVWLALVSISAPAASRRFPSQRAGAGGTGAGAAAAASAAASAATPAGRLARAPATAPAPPSLSLASSTSSSGVVRLAGRDLFAELVARKAALAERCRAGFLAREAAAQSR
jgi:hypothetical protein